MEAQGRRCGGGKEDKAAGRGGWRWRWRASSWWSGHLRGPPPPLHPAVARSQPARVQGHIPRELSCFTFPTVAATLSMAGGGGDAGLLRAWGDCEPEVTLAFARGCS